MKISEIERCRLDAGLSIEETAAFLDVTPRTVYRWERNRKPDRRFVKRLMPLMKESTSDNLFTFLDLYSGIGGFRLAAEARGGMCVGSIERDRYARTTYGSNFSLRHPMWGDVSTTNTRELPKHQLLMAGFPCQPFSTAAKTRFDEGGALKSEDGNRFFDVVRILRDCKTPTFILENVPGLLKHDGEKTLKIMMSTLKSLGYKLSLSVINSEPWVPQRRKRVFIVGSRKPFSLPKGHFEETTYGPDFSTIMEDTTGQLTDEQWLLTQQSSHGYSVVGGEEITRTLLASYASYPQSLLVQTEGNPRKLTVREGARLMGFPETFDFPVSYTQAFKQLGNSVVVPLVTELLKEMQQQKLLPRIA
jgi:DNA (cytosine-5)-methyltransferase 1